MAAPIPEVRELAPGHWRCEVIVLNQMGLHARPAMMVAQEAGKHACEICVHKGNQQVDGKSVLQVMTLAAEQGTPLALEARGGDARSALEALARLFADSFSEAERQP